MPQPKSFTDLLDRLDKNALALLPEAAKVDLLLQYAEYLKSLEGSHQRRTQAQRDLEKILTQHKIEVIRPLFD